MRHLAVALLLAGTMPAFAQEEGTVGQGRCWLGGMSYSPGATARAGNAVMVCTSGLVWEITSDWAAGCLHDGRFYGIGAVPNASSSQQVLSECQPDGTWRRIEP